MRAAKLVSRNYTTFDPPPLSKTACWSWRRGRQKRGRQRRGWRRRVTSQYVHNLRLQSWKWKRGGYSRGTQLRVTNSGVTPNKCEGIGQTAERYTLTHWHTHATDWLTDTHVPQTDSLIHTHHRLTHWFTRATDWLTDTHMPQTDSLIHTKTAAGQRMTQS